jgi:hypothetical protein
VTVKDSTFLSNEEVLGKEETETPDLKNSLYNQFFQKEIIVFTKKKFCRRQII